MVRMQKAVSYTNAVPVTATIPVMSDVRAWTVALPETAAMAMRTMVRCLYLRGEMCLESARSCDKSVMQEEIMENRIKERKDRLSGVFLYVSVSLWLILSLAGCAGPVSVKPESTRVVQLGDVADINFLCRLQSGEVAASTD